MDEAADSGVKERVFLWLVAPSIKKSAEWRSL